MKTKTERFETWEALRKWALLCPSADYVIVSAQPITVKIKLDKENGK